MAVRTNKPWIDIARVEVRQASVSRLPFSDGAFDIVTAVESHFWSPVSPADLREVLRVLKAGGRPIIIPSQLNRRIEYGTRTHCDRAPLLIP